jgi:hypothetical protein
MLDAQRIVDILATDGGVVALVGGVDAPRIRVDRPYQKDAWPLLLVTVQRQNSQTDLAGEAAGLWLPHVVIKCRAMRHSQRQQLAEAVVAAIDLYSSVDLDFIMDDAIPDFAPWTNSSDEGFYDLDLFYTAFYND